MQLLLVRHALPHRSDHGRGADPELSEIGVEQAARLPAALARFPLSRLVSSPQRRSVQTAEPVAAGLGLPIDIDERIIEPTNAFEGTVGRSAFKNPRYWYRYLNPFRPSWGEPYRSIATRVREAMNDAWDADREGDIVMVSHQAVVWAAHRDVNGEPLFHNPAKRRCELSSITSFERRGGRWFEVDYRTPAAGLMQGSVDVGAV